MYIVSQHGQAIYNFGVMTTVFLNYEAINIGYTEGKSFIFGRYKSEERAEEVFKELTNTLFPPAAIVVKNVDVPPYLEDELKKAVITTLVTKTDDEISEVHLIENRVFYMPEE